MNLYAIPSEHDSQALVKTIKGLPPLRTAVPEPEARIVTGKVNAPAPRPNDDAKHLRLIAQALKAQR